MVKMKTVPVRLEEKQIKFLELLAIKQHLPVYNSRSAIVRQIIEHYREEHTEIDEVHDGS